MGALRLYVMFMVVCNHIHLWCGQDFPFLSIHFYGGTMEGTSRVHMFLLQSGFFTQLAFYNKKICFQSVLDFYKKKVWNIYPQYLIFLFITALYFILKDDSHYLHNYVYNIKSAANYLSICASNIFAISLPSFGVGLRDMHATHGYLFLSASWPLTVLMIFYLLAPFTLTSFTGRLIAVLLSSILMIHSYGAGVIRNLIITELAYCFFGACIAILWLHTRKHFTKQMYLIATILVVPALILVPFGYHKIEGPLGSWGAFFLLNSLFAISMIPLAGLTQKSSFDRFLSKVTYTLLLCHLLMTQIAKTTEFSKTGIELLALLLSIESAFLVNIWWDSRKKKQQENVHD